MKKSTDTRRRQLLLSLPIVLAAIVVIGAATLIRPADERVARASVMLEYERCYALEADGHPLLYLNDLALGSTRTDIATSPDSVMWHRRLVNGCMAYRFRLFPVCKGRILAADPDTQADSLLHALNARITAVTDSNIVQLANECDRLERIIKQLYYYLDVHNVSDEGYNRMATLAGNMTEEHNKRRRALATLRDARKKSSLRLTLQQRYTLLQRDTAADSVSRIPCEIVRRDTARRLVRLQAKDHFMPDGTKAIYDNFRTAGIIARVVGTPRMTRALVEYRGEVENGQRSGHGILVNHGNNTYYDGMWKDDRRNGFGLAIDSTGRLQVGEWQDNIYKGERLTYTDERIYGIDISRFQHDIGKHHYAIDWGKIRIHHLGTISQKRVKGTVDYPVSFVYIKSTEGTTITNPYYARDYADAQRHGFRTGSYHFFSLKSGAAEQARHFLRTASLNAGDFPPMLDVEPSAAQIQEYGGTEALSRSIRTWLTLVEQSVGVRPILYVGQSFVNKYLPDAPDIMRDYRVWIARYGEYKPDVQLAIWQLSPDGRVSGIQGDVDINVFNGYNDEYEDFIDAQCIKPHDNTGTSTSANNQ